MRREIEPRGIERNTQHTAQRPGQAGFSLVELMVVITIIGILAGIAVPKFQSFRARASQTEAKSGLNAVFLSVQAYEANYGGFPSLSATAFLDTINEIGFSTGGSKNKYQYSIVSNTINGFAAMARTSAQLVDDRRDLFRINTNKWVCQPFDAITNAEANVTADVQTQANPLDCPEKRTKSEANSATDSQPSLKKADCPLGTLSGTCTTT